MAEQVRSVSVERLGAPAPARHHGAPRFAVFDADPSVENAAKKATAEERYRKAVAVNDDVPHEFDAERLENRADTEFGKQP